jgi:hypothetical protein
MKCTIKVMAQYHENYSDTNTPYWKPKGGQEFQIVMDSDIVMYSNDLVKHLTDVVSSQSDEHNKYSYLEHDVEFIKPVVLDSEVLLEKIRKEAA